MQGSLPVWTQRALTVFTVLAMLACTTFESAQAQLIVGHRGASHEAPENTLAAFDLAFDQNADAIEGDFHLTADGRVVCLHDADFRRTGNDRRRVVDMTLDEITQLDVGSWKHERYRGQVAPTLEVVLQSLPADARFFIELKAGPEIVPATLAAIDTTGIDPRRLTIIAFDPDVIAAVEAQRPSLTTLWLVRFDHHRSSDRYTPTPSAILATLDRINADGLDTQANLDVLTEPFVQRLRQHGYQWHCWTVDDPRVARRLIALGVDSLTTNQPGPLRDALADRLTVR